jgi:uncharacterized protein (TIGR03435 family)
MFRKTAFSLLWLYLLAAPLRAAAQDNSVPGTAIAQVRFEVASIHPSGPGASAQNAGVSFTLDRLDARAATVGDILDMLNGWQLLRVVGGPEWMWTDRYDVHAKADAPIPKKERQGAVLALLAERFKLVVHRETRDIPAMVLLAPKRPAGLKPAADGETYSVRYGSHGDVTFVAVPMSQVINYLSQIWQLPVVDQTGLAGTFDFSLSPSEVTPQPGEVWSNRVREAVLALGFSVEMKKVPMEVTVVDHCERPSEN